jgi:Cu/Ag efflux pump CusA
MVRWLVGTSLKYRYQVLWIALVVMVLGILQLRSIPVDLFP